MAGAASSHPDYEDGSYQALALPTGLMESSLYRLQRRLERAQQNARGQLGEATRGDPKLIRCKQSHQIGKKHASEKARTDNPVE